MANDPMDELKKRANELVERMQVVAAERDVEKQTQLIADLARDAQAFEELGKRYVQQENKRLGRGFVQVQLTPEQQLKILNRTGVKMDLLVVEDQVGALNQAMPLNQPDDIELLAMEEAMRRKQSAESEVILRRQVDHVIADLEAQNNSDINAQLNQLREDPNFLGGMTRKK